MEPLETVETFTTRLDAELALRWLEDDGVSARLVDLAATSEGISATLIEAQANREVAGVSVAVAREDLERARAILQSQAQNDDLPATGITACPERISKKPDEDQPESERDEVARRACLAAAFGLGTLPLLLHLYSLLVLLGFQDAKGPLSESGKRYLIIAIVIDALVLSTVVLFLVLVCSGLFSATG